MWLNILLGPLGLVKTMIALLGSWLRHPVGRILLFAGASLLIGSWLGWRMRAHQVASLRAELVNERAAHDTTRTLYTKAGRIYARLLFSRSVELADALAAGASGEPVVDVRIVAVPAGIDTVYLTPPAQEVADGTFTDTLRLAGPPVQGSVAATLARDRPSRWDVRLQPSPVGLDLGITCADGQPELLVSAPEWIERVSVDSGTTDPAVCPVGASPGMSRLHTVALTAGATAGFIGLLSLIF